MLTKNLMLEKYTKYVDKKLCQKNARNMLTKNLILEKCKKYVDKKPHIRKMHEIC